MRSILRTSLAIVSLCCALAGCNKSSDPASTASTSTPAATVTPVQPTTGPIVGPTTAPAAQPVVSSMMINQLITVFPGARLRLETTDDHMTAILYSADPPNAINNDYTGNSYYLKIPLAEVKDPSGINGAEWHYKSLTSDRSDSHEGIFLNGLQQQLQPIDMVVKLETLPKGIRVQLAGEFMAYGNAPGEQPGVLTSVSGELTADVDVPTKP
jgi:predicted component of type VI protein secretion system